MGRDDAGSGRNTTHQDHTVDLIKAYHHFAPAMLSLREPHVPPRWEEPAMVPVSICVPMRAVRRRLGAVLLRLGGHLCDGHPAAAQQGRGPPP